jgi:carbon-monoxide dehydrogenase medium subunit
LKLTNGTSERIVPVEEFFVGPEKTVLRNGELLREIRLNDPPACSRAVYIKHTLRRSMEIAIVGVAAMITADPTKQICEDIRIAFGAVAPMPVRARQAEAVIKGKKVDNDLIDRVAWAATREIRPISDFRSSAEYRREMATVLTRRAIVQAWEKAIS